MSENYYATTTVDTILCLENMDVIGSYLAEALTEAGILSKNSHKTMYIARPEYNSAGQIIFRQNTLHMVMNKNVLLLTATVSTGTSRSTKERATTTSTGGTTTSPNPFPSSSKTTQDHGTN